MSCFLFYIMKSLKPTFFLSPRYRFVKITRLFTCMLHLITLEIWELLIIKMEMYISHKSIRAYAMMVMINLEFIE